MLLIVAVIDLVVPVVVQWMSVMCKRTCTRYLVPGMVYHSTSGIIHMTCSIPKVF